MAINNVLKFPITDVLQPDAVISKELPFCPYGGPLQGVLGAVAQGQIAP